MGEPERRRRRLRATHATSDLPDTPASAPVDGAPTDEAVVTVRRREETASVSTETARPTEGTASAEITRRPTGTTSAEITRRPAASGGAAPDSVEAAAATVPAETVGIATTPILDPPAGDSPAEEAPSRESLSRESSAGDSPAEEAFRKPRGGFGARPRPATGDDREVERGLRGLVGSGSSQVSVGAALRARDAARPTDAQFAEAERDLTIVRRNWTPREDLPRNR